MVRTTRPNQKVGIANKDTFTRMNYIYQAAHLVLTQHPGNKELIRFYAHTLKSMAKKQVLRVHPDIKRTICKKCYMLLVPGITATFRKKGKKQDHMVVKCLECHTPKRFPTKADYKLWAEKPEAWFAMYPPGAPLPVRESTLDEQGASTSANNTRSCSHRRCKQYPHCRKQSKSEKNKTLDVSSCIADSKSDPTDTNGQEKNLTEAMGVSIHIGDTKSIGEVAAECSTNSKLNCIRDTTLLDSEDVLSQNTDRAIYLKSEANCDIKTKGLPMSQGLKRSLNPATELSNSKKSRCDETENCNR